MEPTLIPIACPSCRHRFDLPADAVGLPPARLYLAILEAECPECGWEFSVNAEGTLLDDGDLDAEGLFSINDDGEWVAEEWLHVECPHCGNRHDTDEPGVTACTHCKHTFYVDETGRPRLRGRGDRDPDCPKCGAPMPGEEEGYFLDCRVCGAGFMPWSPDHDEEEEDD